MADTKSVVIRLTNEQREAIKRATGKDITELKVDALEGRITPGAEFSEFRKAPLANEDRKAPAADLRKAPFAEARKAPLDVVEDRKAPMLDERKAPMLDERKAPLDIDSPAENRKAPLSTTE